jgi:hypothetical protein
MSDAAVLLRAGLARAREGRPYPGFRPFRRNEWPIFFGRERQVQDLLGLLAAQHFISIHGPSGGGKSSLIEAGLIATLKREHARLDTAWCINTFRPGTSPMWNLARGLLRALHPNSDPSISEVVEAYSLLLRTGGSITKVAKKYGLGDANLLLVADQFEELFRFRMLGDKTEADRFVDLLLDVFDEQPKGVHIVVATRSDFLGDCSDIVGLAEAVNAAPYLTPALTEDELRAAIRGPADLHGGKVDDAVVEQMLNDSAGQPDRLPILQHALMRCWDVADRRGAHGKITLQLYNSEEIKGVANALHNHAEEVMKSPELKGLEGEVELVFKALTELDFQGRAIRRPLPWAQLLAESGYEPPTDLSDEERQTWWKQSQSLPMARVVNRFRADGTGFLGRPGPDEKELKQDTLVDVAHEALIRRWRRLNRLAKPGTGGPRQREGWLWDEAVDGNLYRALLLDAQSKIPIIDPWNMKQRLQWWRRQPQTAAWARRMAGDRDATNQDAKAGLDRISMMFTRSRWLWWGGIVLLVALLCLFADYVRQRVMFTEQLEENAANLQARDVLHRVDLQQLIRISAERNEAQLQLKSMAASLDRANARADAAEKAAGPRAPAIAPPVPADRSTEVAAAARPVAQTTAPASSAAAPSCKGAVWIGSGNAANLRFAEGDAGRTVTLDDVQPNRKFVSGVNLRLRRGVPNPEGYIHQEPIGIVPVGAQITALGIPVRYDRPSGPQYWLDVAVPSQVCSLVYFQFAGGTADNARALAAALEKQGYLVPGQQQLSSAQGLAEVRYYYAEDRPAAEQLATDAAAAAKVLGLAANRQIEVKDLTGWPRQKPPRGTLELWLDLASG